MADENVPARAQAVGYMGRTREYYRALGYQKDYRWAVNQETPFCQPSKRLQQSRIGLVTTSSPAGTTKSSLPQVWWADSAQPPASLYTDNLAWDKAATHTDDTGTFLPIRAMQALVAQGVVGELAPRYYGIPSEYSQRHTLQQDAPEILHAVRQDQVDAVLLIPL